MKKEINELLKSERAYLNINEYCSLKRWTKDAYNEVVDCLEVEFSITSKFDYIAKIESRDWQGIVAEIQEHQAKAFASAAEKYNSELKAGYLRKKAGIVDY